MISLQFISSPPLIPLRFLFLHIFPPILFTRLCVPSYHCTSPLSTSLHLTSLSDSYDISSCHLASFHSTSLFSPVFDWHHILPSHLTSLLFKWHHFPCLHLACSFLSWLLSRRRDITLHHVASLWSTCHLFSSNFSPLRLIPRFLLPRASSSRGTSLLLTSFQLVFASLPLFPSLSLFVSSCRFTSVLLSSLISLLLLIRLFLPRHRPLPSFQADPPLSRDYLSHSFPPPHTLFILLPSLSLKSSTGVCFFFLAFIDYLLMETLRLFCCFLPLLPTENPSPMKSGLLKSSHTNSKYTLHAGSHKAINKYSVI